MLFACVTGNLLVVALSDIQGLNSLSQFALRNLYQSGDTIHMVHVEDTAGPSGSMSQDDVEQGLKSDSPDEKVKHEFTHIKSEGKRGTSDNNINKHTMAYENCVHNIYVVMQCCSHSLK